MRSRNRQSVTVNGLDSVVTTTKAAASSTSRSTCMATIANVAPTGPAVGALLNQFPKVDHGSVIALASKVVGLNNLNLTTTRGDRLIEARPPRSEWLWAGFDQTTSYTKPWDATLFR
jgi:hypothetical protein